MKRIRDEFEGYWKIDPIIESTLLGSVDVLPDEIWLIILKFCFPVLYLHDGKLIPDAEDWMYSLTPMGLVSKRFFELCILLTGEPMLSDLSKPASYYKECFLATCARRGDIKMFNWIYDAKIFKDMSDCDNILKIALTWNKLEFLKCAHEKGFEPPESGTFVFFNNLMSKNQYILAIDILYRYIKKQDDLGELKNYEARNYISIIIDHMCSMLSKNGTFEELKRLDTIILRSSDRSGVLKYSSILASTFKEIVKRKNISGIQYLFSDSQILASLGYIKIEKALNILLNPEYAITNTNSDEILLKYLMSIFGDMDRGREKGYLHHVRKVMNIAVKYNCKGFETSEIFTFSAPNDDLFTRATNTHRIKPHLLDVFRVAAKHNNLGLWIKFKEVLKDNHIMADSIMYDSIGRSYDYFACFAKYAAKYDQMEYICHLRQMEFEPGSEQMDLIPVHVVNYAVKHNRVEMIEWIKTRAYPSWLSYERVLETSK